MKRLIAVISAVAGLSVVGVGSAAPANRGCPTGFTLAPVSVLGPDFTGVADNVNHDGLICIRSLKNGGGVFIDNTAP